MTSWPGAVAVRTNARLLRGVALVLAVVVVVLGSVAASGGFARAVPVQGPRAGTGETVDLTRFRVVVDRVELVDVDDYGSKADPPTLRVWLQATNTSDRSVDSLPSGMVVVVADGVALTGYIDGVGDRDAALDPDLAHPLRYLVDWTAPAAPTRVDVVVYDEKAPAGFLDDSTTPDVDPSHPAAVVAVPLRDLRHR